MPAPPAGGDVGGAKVAALFHHKSGRIRLRASAAPSAALSRQGHTRVHGNRVLQPQAAVAILAAAHQRSAGVHVHLRSREACGETACGSVSSRSGQEHNANKQGQLTSRKWFKYVLKSRVLTARSLGPSRQSPAATCTA